MTAKITEKQEKLIAEMYSEGIRQGKIAEALNISVASVKRIRRKYNLSLQMPQILEGKHKENPFTSCCNSVTYRATTTLFWFRVGDEAIQDDCRYIIRHGDEILGIYSGETIKETMNPNGNILFAKVVL